MSQATTTIVAPRRRSFLVIWAMLLVVPGLTACGQGLDAEAGAAQSPIVTATNQVQSSGQVVEVTPLSDAALATEPAGQSEPGAAATSETVQPDPGASEPQPQTGATLVYADSTHMFEVAHPADFVVRTLPAEKLALLMPRPDAGYTFMNPATAASDTPELEPADLEIRAYLVTQQPATLEAWLVSNGLLPADGSIKPKPFQKGAGSGLEVCASTMLAPGCSYFVSGTTRIYQLIPVTLAGEAMIETFKPTT